MNTDSNNNKPNYFALVKGKQRDCKCPSIPVQQVTYALYPESYHASIVIHSKECDSDFLNILYKDLNKLTVKPGNGSIIFNN